MAGVYRVQDEAWDGAGAGLRDGEGVRPATAILQTLENGRFNPGVGLVPLAQISNR